MSSNSKGIITNINAEIEHHRSIEHCGEYGVQKKAKAGVYVDPCAGKSCFPCKFDVFISCPNSWLNE